MDGAQRELPVGSGSRVGANGTALAARRSEAWRLRVEERMTYAEIGEAVGCSPSTACQYVQDTLAEHAPTSEEVEAHRADLIARASARLSLWAERADRLHEAADEERYTKTVTRRDEVEEVPNELKPRLYANAAAAERTAIAWAEKLAKWTGIEVQQVEAPDLVRDEARLAETVEAFLAGVAAVEARRPSVNGNGHRNGSG